MAKKTRDDRVTKIHTKSNIRKLFICRERRMYEEPENESDDRKYQKPETESTGKRYK